MLFINIKAPGSKEELFINMLESMQSQHGLLQELSHRQCELADVLMSREKIGDTCVAPGIALAHAMIEGLRQVVLAAGILDSPMDWDGENQVHLVFMLLIPSQIDNAGKLLARGLMSNLANDEIAAAMARARTIEELKPYFQFA